MPKRVSFGVLLILILIVSAGAYIYVQKTQSDVQKAADVSDFDLIFKYGVGAKNELNTYNGTYVKDMVTAPSVTTNLSLTIEEKRQILQRIAEIGFFSLPDNFTLNPSEQVSPQVDYYIKVQNGSQFKEVSWSNNSLIESDIQNSLDGLVNYLISVIQNKPEYEALPTPSAGYI